MDLLGQSALILAIMGATLGLTVLARNVRNRFFWSFAGMCLLITVWALSFSFEKIWRDGFFYRVHLYSNVWLAPVALLFIQGMVRFESMLNRVLVRVAGVIAVGLTLALAFGLDRSGHYRKEIQFLVLFCPGVAALSLLRLVFMDFKGETIKQPLRPPLFGRRQRSVVHLLGMFLLLFCSMDHIPWGKVFTPPIGEILPVLGNLGLAVFLNFLSRAISEQRLLNLGSLLSRFLVLLVFSLMLTVFFLLFVAWIDNSPALFFLNVFVASFMLVSLLDPLQRGVGHFTRSLAATGQRQLEEQVFAATRRLSKALNEEELKQSLLETVQTLLEPKSIRLLVLASDGVQYRSQTGEPVDSGYIAFVLGALGRMEKRGESAILLDSVLESELERTVTQGERYFFARVLKAMNGLGGNLIVPISGTPPEKRVYAFLVLDAPEPPPAWGKNWGLLTVFQPFFEQAGKSFGSMESFKSVRDQDRLMTLGEMAAGLAHEIRNPLGAIKGAVQVLESEKALSQNRFLQVILEEVDRLNRVVSQFLEYSKPSMSDRAPIDLGEVVSSTLSFLKPSVPPSITIEWAAPGKPFPILGSPEQLRQVLLNLIQNSFKACESLVGARIKVSLIQKQQSAILSVEDTGAGISPEDLDRIFIPFFTSHPSGTGLGLSICQKIIEAHQGQIKVESKKGQGTQVQVILSLSNPVGGPKN